MASQSPSTDALTLFLCGDVMLGRGVDQRMPRSVEPRLHEPFVRDARRYVELAERASGSLPDEIGFDYVWGEALAVLEEAGLDACVLANNHALDWGRDGLTDTLSALHDSGIETPGAGRDAADRSCTAAATS